jgi:Putative lumazine-binding
VSSSASQLFLVLSLQEMRETLHDNSKLTLINSRNKRHFVIPVSSVAVCSSDQARNSGACEGKMKLIVVLIVITASIVLLSMAHTRDSSAEARDEVLAVIKTLTDGWREADQKKVDAALHPDFRLVTLRESPTRTEIDTREHLIKTVDQIKPGDWDDRLKIEDVRIDASGIATVWASFEFFSHGKRTHCGIESFQLYRMADGWKIINFADTHSSRFCK